MILYYLRFICLLDNCEWTDEELFIFSFNFFHGESFSIPCDSIPRLTCHKEQNENKKDRMQEEKHTIKA